MPSRTSKVRFRPGNLVALLEALDDAQGMEVVVEGVAKRAICTFSSSSPA